MKQKTFYILFIFLGSSSALGGELEDNALRESEILINTINTYHWLSLIPLWFSTLIVFGMFFLLWKHSKLFRIKFIQILSMIAIPIVVTLVILFFIINPLVNSECTEEIVTLQCIPDHIVSNIDQLDLTEPQIKIIKSIEILKKSKNILGAFNFFILGCVVFINYLFYLIVYLFLRKNIQE